MGVWTGNQNVVTPYASRILQTSHHQILLNFMDTLLQSVEETKINAGIRAAELAVFGHEVGGYVGQTQAHCI